MTPVALELLVALFDHTRGRVRYRLGAKAPSLQAASSEITHLDCSGFVRWIIYRATQGQVTLPDGSWAQREWCREQGLHRLARYADVAHAARDPHRLFIAFLPSVRGRAGHVWLVRAGATLECHGGKGVNSRAWDCATLVRSADAAFELPAK